MKPILSLPGFSRLLVAQAQVAFNDNATKLALMGLAALVLAEPEASRTVSGLAALLVMPFVLFAPIAGWVSDRCRKRDVVLGALGLQLAVMALLGLGTISQSFPLIMGAFFLLGLQSALMSPAKRGLVQELVGERRVGEGMGWLEMLVVVSILTGSLAGGALLDGVAERTGSGWSAGAWTVLILGLGCALGWGIFFQVPAQPSGSSRPFRLGLFWGHVEQVRELWRRPALFRAALGDATFYFLGGVLALTLFELGRELYPKGPGAARATGVMLATVGAGVMGGALSAGRLCREGLKLGLVPLGALGIVAALLLLGGSQPETVWFYGALAGMGYCGGLFLVPVSGVLVGWSPAEKKGEILAGANLVSSVAGVAAVGAQALAGQVLGLSWRGQVLLLALVALAAGIYLVRLLPDELLRLTALGWAKLHYRVRVKGAEHVPAEGGALVVCNHVSYVDVVCLSMACPRPIRFLADETLFRVPVLGSILRIFGAVPVRPQRAKEALVRAAEAVQAGELVCIFPEGMLTRTGVLMELKGGYERIARRAGCRVLVAQMDGLWGSIFSFARGRYFLKWPTEWRRSVTVSFAPPLKAEEADINRVRQTVLDLGEVAFRERDEWTAGLGAGLVRGLSRRPWRVALVDRMGGRREVRRVEILALAWALAARWRRVPGKRIGIVLPPGAGGVLANVAAVLAGKVPVNLNPTIGSATFGSACTQAGIEVVVTAERVKKKFPGLPWPNEVIDLMKEIQKVPKAEIVGRMIAVHLLPFVWLRRWVTGGKVDPESEAVLLFTSGSSGTPKGVPLSHRNVLGNLRQLAETGLFQSEDTFLGSLPLFHSFGLTVGLWHPLVAGARLVTVPSPLEAGLVGQAVAEEKVTVLTTTPTFLRSYVKRWEPSQVESVRLLMTGAERLAPGFAEEVKTLWGRTPREGYGLTETSPVLAVNQPDPAQGPGASAPQTGGCSGSVGRLLPGVSYRLFDPETGEGAAERGVLAVRGVNVFQGYFERPEATAEAFRDGWLVTGDVVRVNGQGFIIIEGRLSRFSKIGGEMVPHGTVEEVLMRAFPPAGGGTGHVIVALSDRVKGEQLVLITEAKLEPEWVRAALEREGLPALWVPRQMVQVNRIPMLASGKVDLAKCRALADLRDKGGPVRN